MSINKGFTIIEMMITLMIICMIMLLTIPIKSISKQSYEIQQLQLLLMQYQNEADYSNQKIKVVIDGNDVYFNDKHVIFHHLNANYVHFSYNEVGHISNALTITFKNSSKKIVLQLGSGNSEIR